MRFFRAVGLESVAWSLRRIYCPVPASALVLEVGSGGNPYPRANVLIDAYEVTRERHWVPLKADRPIVLGFVEKLPFKDKVFDFVIASHVFEHSPDPEVFLSELQRVAKAGYIEVPDAFFERLSPYHDHRLEITVRDGALVIRKKASWRTDEDLVELLQHKAGRFVIGLFSKRPFHFHVRYYWEDRIDFKVVNPGVDAAWPVVQANYQPPPPGFVARIRGGILEALRGLLSQRARNARIDIMSLLRCPACGGTGLSRGDTEVTCACSARYPLRNGIPAMFAPELKALTK